MGGSRKNGREFVRTAKLKSVKPQINLKYPMQEKRKE
jgi:hypothetical protein